MPAAMKAGNVQIDGGRGGGGGEVSSMHMPTAMKAGNV